MLPKNSTNLKNRVNKLHLPRTKPLLPLFEIISNSIHAIQEKGNEENNNFLGKIEVTIIRNGDEKTLKELPDVDKYPIHSFQIKDNGIGFNNENIVAFAEFDTERKAKIGGKGIGRLVCLKGFHKIIVESVYQENTAFKIRNFEYKKSKEGFDNYADDLPTNKKNTETVVELHKFEDEYTKYVPRNIYEIAREIITHFQLYFIRNIDPEIIIKNQNNIEINLRHLYKLEFAKEILQKPFNIGDNNFGVIISKSYKAKSHKIHYCAHQRTVKEEGVSKYLEDLRFQINSKDFGQSFFYEVFVVGEYLDNNVNEERTNFNFKNDEDENETDFLEISLSKIRRETIVCIEDLLSDFLKETRKEKLDGYYPIIESEFPNYLGVINHNKSKVERLPVGLSKAELDIKLYEIESEWRIQVKKEGVELLEKKKDITTLDEYKSLYEKFFAEFNEIGQSDLTRYIVHRRSVIDLLDKLIELNQENKFTNEDIVHSLFFPIRETKDSILHEKQNLWLLDERLTFNTLLASDKLFKQIDAIGSSSSDRMDLIVKKEEIFENAALFSEEKIPYESFTIVEFKKPERDDYKQGDREKDPIKQVRSYIDEIVKNKAKVRGKSLGASKSTPFYCYIVADITETLNDILEYETFDPTPDGLGYFRFYDTKTYRAYIEVLPFKKIIKDAKQRNKILFDKLKLS
jgi:hypothetical protein